MTLDDYQFVNLYRDHSFIKAQAMTYFGWDGRFFSSFLKGVFTKSGIISHYYFLSALLFLLFTWFSLFLLLRTINKYLLSAFFTGEIIMYASFILFVVELYTMADIASGVYWFSSVVVYQPAFILFIFLLSCLIRRFYSNHSSNIWLKDSIIILLILTNMGCNEIAGVFLILFLLLILAMHYFYNHRISSPLLIYLFIAIFVGALTTLTSGVLSVRHSQMNTHTSYLTVLPIILFRMITVFYYIFKEPLFWITSLLLLIAGIRTGQHPTMATMINILKGRRILQWGLLITLLLVFGTLTPVLIVSKGSFPARALNNLTSFTTLSLLTTFFLTGLSYSSLNNPLNNIRISFTVGTIIVGCGLLASTNYWEAWKSTFSGYFYHAAIKDRERLMVNAGSNHQSTVIIKPFKEVLQHKIHEVFPNGTFVSLNELLQEPPTILFYNNEAENPSQAYLHYYRLEKIIVEKKSSCK